MAFSLRLTIGTLSFSGFLTPGLQHQNKLTFRRKF
ncbi:unnamed protein product [Arabidopsis halleri]